MTVSLGIIGFGNFGRQLVKCFHETGLCRIKTIAVNTPSRHVEAALPYSAELVDDYRRMLADPTIDAVAVCGPVDLQPQMVVEALAAGKHVFMEKPLAADLQGGLRIKAAADASDRVVMVGFVERFNPSLRRVKALLRNDYLGELFRLSIKRGSRCSERTPWMWDVGMFVHILGHNIDILRWFLEDEVEHVYAESDAYMRTNKNEDDNICAILRFRKGALAVMEDTWTLSPNMPMEENDTRLDLIGTKGNLSVNNLNQMIQVCNDTKGWFYPGILRWPGGLTEDGGVEHYALKDECAYFLRCIQDRSLAPLSDVDSALMNLKVALACRLSAKEKRTVYLAEFNA